MTFLTQLYLCIMRTCWATQPTVAFGPQITGTTVFTLILDEIIQKMDDFIVTNFLSTYIKGPRG